jgi:DNA-binding CsgD family transcriptional regulator
LADEFYVSRRVVDLRIAEFKKAWGVRTRFQLGVMAVRSGAVAAADVLAHAERGRNGDDWTKPSAPQRALLSRCADGLTVKDAAAELGVSRRTAERHLGHLASVNGVEGRVGLGALSEALGFV